MCVSCRFCERRMTRAAPRFRRDGSVSPSPVHARDFRPFSGLFFFFFFAKTKIEKANRRSSFFHVVIARRRCFRSTRRDHTVDLLGRVQARRRSDRRRVVKENTGIIIILSYFFFLSCDRMTRLCADLQNVVWVIRTCVGVEWVKSQNSQCYVC